MADSYNKKERNKKKEKRKREKAERKLKRKQEGKKTAEFMYLDENGHLTATPPDPNKKKVEVKAEDIEIGVPKKEETGLSAFERHGRVKFFDTNKGYGFIEDTTTKVSYFVHSNSLKIEIKENNKVIFEMGKGPKGPLAENVRLAE